METIIANALPVAGLLILALVCRIFYERTKLKKTFLILDLVVHLALVALMVVIGAGMEELLLVLLFTMAIALA